MNIIKKKSGSYVCQSSKYTEVSTGSQLYGILIYINYRLHCEFESCHEELYSIQQNAIKFVSDVSWVAGFVSLVLLFPLQ